MKQPERTAMALSLETLTSVPRELRDEAAQRLHPLRPSDHGVECTFAGMTYPWLQGSAEEALTAAVSRGIVGPWPSPALAPRICGRTGCAMRSGACTAESPTQHADRGDVLSVASLGPETVRAAEELGRSICRRYAYIGGFSMEPAAVVFRVMSERELMAHHMAAGPTIDSAAAAFSLCIAPDPLAAKLSEPEEWAKDEVYGSWEAMRGIADLGLHLLAASWKQVAIGVWGVW